MGHVCAAFFAAQGEDVCILSGHPDNWHHEVTCYDKYDKCYSGHLHCVSSNPQEVVANADIVLLCLPGYLIKNTLERIKPYLHKSSIVGSIVSSTGFFFFAHEVLGNEFSLFGFQRVPFIARVRNYGKDADLLGYKPSVNVAIEPVPNTTEKAEEIRLTLERLFKTPTVLLESFYEASLTNSNPLLHTSRLYTMWHNHDGQPIDKPQMFYADWTDEASEMLIAMDKEFMHLLKVLGVREGAIPPILEYYECKDAPSLTRKIRSIEAFKEIKSPLKATDEGWMPDYSSRYFTEDFPYGLKFIKMLADDKVETPNIDKVFAWGLSKI